MVVEQAAHTTRLRKLKKINYDYKLNHYFEIY